MEIIQYIPKDNIPEQYRDCMENVLLHKPETVDYRLMNSHPFKIDKIENDYRFESDKLRCILASINESMVWLDCDIKVGGKGFFKPYESNIPYFYCIHGMPDICAFYVNGATDFFKHALQHYDNTKPKTCGWFQGFIRSQPCETYRFIPDGHFIHLSYGHKYGGVKPRLLTNN